MAGHEQNLVILKTFINEVLSFMVFLVTHSMTMSKHK